MIWNEILILMSPDTRVGSFTLDNGEIKIWINITRINSVTWTCTWIWDSCQWWICYKQWFPFLFLWEYSWSNSFVQVFFLELLIPSLTTGLEGGIEDCGGLICKKKKKKDGGGTDWTKERHSPWLSIPSFSSLLGDERYIFKKCHVHGNKLSHFYQVSNLYPCWILG